MPLRRVMMEDETVFPFKSLTVEPGKFWRAKAKAFKNAGDRALGRSAFRFRNSYGTVGESHALEIADRIKGGEKA